MFISATPRRAVLCHATDDATLLIFECTASDSSGVLEIGKRHLFASRKNRRVFSTRRACKLHVQIKRRSSASEEIAENLNLSTDKVGKLTFCPPLAADVLSVATPAALDATVFLDDQLFESLLSALYSGKRPQWLQLDIEKVGTIGYGWEPDGSRMVWKIDDPSKPASIDISGVSMGIELFN